LELRHHALHNSTQNSLSSSTSSSSEYVDVEYRDKETYLDVTINIFGYSGMDTTLKSGRVNYPFQFVLPCGLPSSLKGEHGSIKYSLQAVIGQSWAFGQKSYVPFHVVGVVDLNSEPTAQMPVVVKARKTFGILFQSGPLDVTLRIPRGGAVPGEYVPFVAEIFNKSDKTVTECLSLHQKVEYFARGKSKQQKNTILEMLGEALKPGADHVWHDNVLQIPQITPTSSGSCRLINVKYKLELEMKVSGIGFNLEASTPFVIGNIPFRNAIYQPTVPEQCLDYDPPPPYTEKGEKKSNASNADDFELL
ncbi:Arrestin domain-containing protein 3, partial [Pseudolycoriella hygida]